ncbi:HpcH/HpaI aldolase/citrate lyase family protein [Nocardioides sp. Iso805N]|uniref:HpcH/HpaI aldolase/citrate lyase family protein n=1 Tax=Nocardioides sp. Iso805N TaxID=1283287 RepID=UPI0003610FEF|nr:aldolase/citrate lyase family protein [Nocardioides sp. Iso805N]
MLPRSFLYVPASRPALFAKAAASGADAVILDLEDAVPTAEKDEARAAVAAWLDGERPAGGPPTWVRVDAAALAPDVAAAVRPGIDGLIVAKCSRAALADVADLLEQREAEHDLAPVPVVGLVEDAAALVDLAAITAHPRLTTLGVGEVDLLGDLRLTRGPSTVHAVNQLRLQIVLHCAAAGLAAPVAPTSTDFRDLEAFRRTTHELVDLGFRSRTAVHPAQVPVIHEVLAPDQAQAAAAQDVVDRFVAAAGGVTVDANGRLIDAAVIRAAKETLARHSSA